MKKIKNLYHEIYDINNINKVFNLVRKTTKNKKEVMQFEVFKNINLNNISNELENKNYNMGKYRIFMVKEPKYRLIMCENIKDKIINHLVSLHVLGPLENSLIYQNVATRKNKGGKCAFDLIKKYINTLMLENKEIYILKLDIKKYFYNIDHNILKKKLSNKIKDKDALNILYDIIDSTNEEYINECISKMKNYEIYKVKKSKLSNKEKELKINEINKIPYYEYGKGLPIGNMSSQFMAIFYLNDVDHFIKEELGYECYIRYMDDLVLLDTDKERLIKSRDLIEKKINEEKLNLNEKSGLYKISKGFEFLGYTFKIKSKKLIIRFNNQTVKRIGRSLKKKKIEDYNLYYKSIRSYKGYFIKSNCKFKNKYIVKEKRMFDKYYNIKKDNKLCLVFLKSGNFYCTYAEDSLIMNYLFNYKVMDGRVGFPVNSINKVLNVLSARGVSCVVLEGNEVTVHECENNDYVNVLGKAHDKLEKDIYIKELCAMVKEKIESDSNNYNEIHSFLVNMD